MNNTTMMILVFAALVISFFTSKKQKKEVVCFVKKELARSFSASRRSNLTAEQKLAGCKKTGKIDRAKMRPIWKTDAFGLDANRRVAVCC